jgi:hypothetical protein
MLVKETVFNMQQVMYELCKRKFIKWKNKIRSQLGFTLQQQLPNKAKDMKDKYKGLLLHIFIYEVTWNKNNLYQKYIKYVIQKPYFL